ncbi:HAMP domain-containing sensor histidine kinase [Microbacterium sp. 18062]|uniref:sensor histidine kinase n=1 Tax=Microbacterium sp. 18062 TaxID=2681410 RepID=UPI001359244D|nr:HAMP domain-containing sensor histidine kinase [Microbacterium sp. 18062]
MTDEPAPTPRRRRAISVRTRITLVITVVAAIGVMSVGGVVYVFERARVLTQIDERLAANLETARYIVAAGDPAAEEQTAWSSSAAALYAVVQRMSPDDNTGALGIEDGRVTLVPGVQLDVDLTAVPEFAGFAAEQAADGQARIGTYAEHGVQWRYLAAPIAVEEGAEPGAVIYAMAYDVGAELAEINTAARAYLIASAVMVAVIAAAGGIVATRLLRPLRRMRETAARVSAHALSERLPIEGRDDVSELAGTMNDMLDRLDGALDSQRQLLSDVGHELKTPITIVRGYVEVMDPADPEDVRQTQSLAVDELARMGTLVQDLAAAASLHGPAPITVRPVDVADLVEQIVRKASGIAGAEVVTGAIAEGVVPLDAARITQAMLQLVQNAVTHGGGRIAIGSVLVDGMLQLRARDHGPGVPDAMKEVVFERFQRGEDTGGRAGSGLGLNIVRVIARAHGGDVRVEDAVGGGAVFILSVPRTAAPARANAEETTWHPS